jgi:recombinational DNA repair ATPase RecF
MNPKTQTARSRTGRATVTRTVSLYPEQDAALANAEVARRRTDHAASVSTIVRELIDSSLDVDTGRARNYIDARDRAIAFTEDVSAILTRSGCEVIANASVDGPHRVDLLATVAKRRFIVEVKSSGSRDRLELALGNALVLRNDAGLPVVVVCPVIVEPEVRQVYKLARVTLIEPHELGAFVDKFRQERIT